MSDQTKPKISIITPSFNSGRYIEKCIESVLAQTYPDIEYIVMDGGSTDNTVEIIKKYEGRLKFISEKDKGNYDAIRKGFAVAQGDILSWIDSDNYYFDQSLLEKVARTFDQPSRPDMVITNSYSHNDGSERLIEHRPENISYDLLLNKGNKIVPESIFYKKDLYLKAGGMNIDLRLLADYDLWIRLFKISSNYLKLPIFSAVYEIRSDALLRKHFRLAWQESFQVGRKYGRKISARLYFRLAYLKARARFMLVSIIKSSPAIYRFFIKTFR